MRYLITFHFFSRLTKLHCIPRQPISEVGGRTQMPKEKLAREKLCKITQKKRKMREIIEKNKKISNYLLIIK